MYYILTSRLLFWDRIEIYWCQCTTRVQRLNRNLIKINVDCVLIVGIISASMMAPASMNKVIIQTSSTVSDLLKAAEAVSQ